MLEVQSLIKTKFILPNMPYFVTNTFVTYSNNNNCTLQVDASQGRDMIEYEHLLFKTNGRCNTRFFQTILNRNIV